MDLTEHLERARQEMEQARLINRQERQTASVRIKEIQNLLTEIKALQGVLQESLARLNKTLAS